MTFTPRPARRSASIAAFSDSPVITGVIARPTLVPTSSPQARAAARKVAPFSRRRRTLPGSRLRIPRAAAAAAATGGDSPTLNTKAPTLVRM